MLFLIIDSVNHFEDLPTYQLSRISEQDSQLTLLAIPMDSSSNEERTTDGLLDANQIDECDIDERKLTD